jgi:hypothetical protein
LRRAASVCATAFYSRVFFRQTSVVSRIVGERLEGLRLVQVEDELVQFGQVEIGDRDASDPCLKIVARRSPPWMKEITVGTTVPRSNRARTDNR